MKYPKNMHKILLIQESPPLELANYFKVSIKFGKELLLERIFLQGALQILVLFTQLLENQALHMTTWLTFFLILNEC